MWRLAIASIACFCSLPAYADQRASYEKDGQVYLTLDVDGKGRGRLEFVGAPTFDIVDASGSYSIQSARGITVVTRMADISIAHQRLVRSMEARGYYSQTTAGPRVIGIEKGQSQVIGGYNGQATLIHFALQAKTDTITIVTSDDKSLTALATAAHQYFEGMADAVENPSQPASGISAARQVALTTKNGLPLIWPGTTLRLKSVQHIKRAASDYALPAPPQSVDTLAAALGRRRGKRPRVAPA